MQSQLMQSVYLSNPALSPHLRISMDSTFEAESCDLIQSNPIKSMQFLQEIDPIQSNPWMNPIRVQLWVYALSLCDASN